MSFRALPADERQWRGRLFLMIWAIYRHEAFSWWAALADDAQWTRDMRVAVAETTDSEIEAALKIAHEDVGPWPS